MKTDACVADVCLILENTYPYVAGGVSTWVHDMIRGQPDLTFCAVSLLPGRDIPPVHYDLPKNLVCLRQVFLQDLPLGCRDVPQLEMRLNRLQEPLLHIQKGGGLDRLARVLGEIAPQRHRLGRRNLLDSPAAWSLICRMYQASLPDASFLDYFWTWRAQIGGLFAALLSDLPMARLYHTISTGYAGLLAARAKLEYCRPVIVTEHGIYTNERRIEMALADWLGQEMRIGFGLQSERRNLRDLWVETFESYARICYEASDLIVTLYEGNQELQRRDGADPAKMRVIPNGVDYDRLSTVARRTDPCRPTVAFIGRVVPIKDVKLFIHAVALLRDTVPNATALIIGPTQEDPKYAAECRALVAQLGLEDMLRFTGPVKLEDYLEQIDVVVLTSLSEAQPLIVLEAGAAGIPTVATDVGSCREIILGMPGESPQLGPGGVITALADPGATARGIAQLLVDPEFRTRCGEAMRRRVQKSYNKHILNRVYGSLYREFRDRPDLAPAVEYV